MACQARCAIAPARSLSVCDSVAAWRLCVQLVYGDSKLLPPEVPDPATGRRPRTLVVNFDKTIVHCDWTVRHKQQMDRTCAAPRRWCGPFPSAFSSLTPSLHVICRCCFCVRVCFM